MYLGNMLFFFLLCALVVVVPLALVVFGVYRLFFHKNKKVTQTR